MKARTTALLIIGLALLPCCALHPRRHAPYRWDVRGAITAVESETLEIRHKSGQRVRLVVDAKTEILDGDRPAPLSSLSIGIRVSVDVETDEYGVSRAVRVRTAR